MDELQVSVLFSGHGRSSVSQTRHECDSPNWNLTGMTTARILRRAKRVVANVLFLVQLSQRFALALL
jgi:hypothetical protein